MTTVSSKTILRSRNVADPENRVLSTLLMRYPRWIHAEQRTHRIISLEEGLEFLQPTPSLMADPNLSRNAASSRAIPVEKLIADMIADPAIPLFWGANQKGMQAGAECNALVFAPVPMSFGGQHLQLVENKGRTREEAWLNAMELAIMSARAFAAAGYHKQIVNRLLEPFTHITVLVSATEWDNFLELRDHGDAEPHIRLLSQEVRKCLAEPAQELEPGEWHLPFMAEDDPIWKELYASDMSQAEAQEAALKVSAARCASTSFKTVEGFDMTLDRALAVFDKLATSAPLHASPFEHIAQADHVYEPQRKRDFLMRHDWGNADKHRNFVGWMQYRAMLPGG